MRDAARTGLDKTEIEGRIAAAKMKAMVNGWQSHAAHELINRDLPLLLAEVRRLETERDRLQTLLGIMESDTNYAPDHGEWRRDP